MTKNSGRKQPSFGHQLTGAFIGFVFGVFLTIVTQVATLLFGPSIDAAKLRKLDEVEKQKAAVFERLINDEADFASQFSHGNKGVEVPYLELFTPDAWIVDVRDRKSAANGEGEIRERLRGLPLTSVSHELTVRPQALTEACAIAQTRSSLKLKNEKYVGYERWFFRKINGRWKIQRLEYNLGESER